MCGERTRLRAFLIDLYKRRRQPIKRIVRLSRHSLPSVGFIRHIHTYGVLWNLPGVTQLLCSMPVLTLDVVREWQQGSKFLRVSSFVKLRLRQKFRRQSSGHLPSAPLSMTLDGSQCHIRLSLFAANIPIRFLCLERPSRLFPSMDGGCTILRSRARSRLSLPLLIRHGRHEGAT